MVLLSETRLQLVLQILEAEQLSLLLVYPKALPEVPMLT